jgi:hypothetical protein
VYAYSALRGPSPSCITVHPTSFTSGLALHEATAAVAEEPMTAKASIAVLLASPGVASIAVPFGSLGAVTVAMPGLVRAFLFFLQWKRHGMSCPMINGWELLSVWVARRFEVDRSRVWSGSLEGLERIARRFEVNRFQPAFSAHLNTLLLWCVSTSSAWLGPTNGRLPYTRLVCLCLWAAGQHVLQLHWQKHPVVERSLSFYCS